LFPKPREIKRIFSPPWESRSVHVQNFIKKFLQNYWEIFLSTYQSSKKKLYFGPTRMSFGFFQELKRPVTGNHFCIFLGGSHEQREGKIPFI